MTKYPLTIVILLFCICDRFSVKKCRMEAGDFDPHAEVVEKQLIPPAAFDHVTPSMIKMVNLIRRSHKVISQRVIPAGDASGLLFSLISRGTEVFQLCQFNSESTFPAFAAFVGVHAHVFDVFVPGARRDNAALRRSLILFDRLLCDFLNDALPVDIETPCQNAMEVIRMLNPDCSPSPIVEYMRKSVLPIIEKLNRFGRLDVNADEVSRELDRLTNVIEKTYALYDRQPCPAVLVQALLNLVYPLHVLQSIVALKVTAKNLREVRKKQLISIKRPTDKETMMQFMLDSLELVILQLRVWKLEREDALVDNVLEKVQHLLGELEVRMDSSTVEKWVEISSMFWKDFSITVPWLSPERMFEIEMGHSRDKFDKFMTAFHEWNSSSNSVCGSENVLAALIDMKEGDLSALGGECVSREIRSFSYLLIYRKLQEDMERIMALMVRIRSLFDSGNVFENVSAFLMKHQHSSPELRRCFVIYLKLLSLLPNPQSYTKCRPGGEAIKELLFADLCDSSRMESVAMAQFSIGFEAPDKRPYQALKTAEKILSLSHYLALKSMERQRYITGLFRCLDLLKSSLDEPETPLTLRKDVTGKWAQLCTILTKIVEFIDEPHEMGKFDDTVYEYLMNITLSVLYEDFKAEEEVDESLKQLESVLVIPVHVDVLLAGFSAISFFDDVQLRVDVGLAPQYSQLYSNFCRCVPISTSTLDTIESSLASIDEKLSNQSTIMLNSLQKYIETMSNIQIIFDSVRSCQSLEPRSISESVLTFSHLALIKYSLSQVETCSKVILGNDLFERVMSYPLSHTLAEISSDEKAAERKELLALVLAKIDYMSPDLLKRGFAAVQQVETLALRIPSYVDGVIKQTVTDLERILEDFVMTDDVFVLRQLFTVSSRLDRLGVDFDEEERVIIALKKFIGDVGWLFSLKLVGLYVERRDTLDDFSETIDKLHSILFTNVSELQNIIPGAFDSLNESDFATLLAKAVDEANTSLTERIERMTSEMATLREETAQMRFAMSNRTGPPSHQAPSVEESDLEEARRERDALYSNPEQAGKRATFNSAISILLDDDSMGNETDLPTLAPEVSFAHRQLSDALKARARIDRDLRILKFHHVIPDLPVPDQIKMLCEQESGKSWIGQEDSYSIHKLRKLRDLQNERDELYKELVREVHEGQRSAVRNAKNIKELMEQLKEMEDDSDSNVNKHNFGDVHARYLSVTSDLYQYILGDTAALERSIARLEKEANQTKEERCRNLKTLMAFSERTINTRR